MKKTIVMIGITMLLSIGMLGPYSPDSFAQGTGAPMMKATTVHGGVIGKPVRNEKGVALGKIENIVLTDNGCVRYVILSGQFRNARGKLYPIPWDQIARVESDTLFVDLDPAILVEAPSFQANRWPDFAQAEWENRVSDFFRNRAHAPTSGKRTEEMKTQQQAPQKQTTEKAVSPKEKMKSKSEMRHEQRFGETPAGAGQKEMDIKARHERESERNMKPGATERTLQRPAEKPEKMMEQGRSGMSHQEKGPGQGNISVPQPEHQKELR